MCKLSSRKKSNFFHFPVDTLSFYVKFNIVNDDNKGDNEMARGRVKNFNDKWNKVNAMGDLSSVSKYYLKQLEAEGYVEFQDVKTDRRGRPAKVAVLTGKGRGYLAMSKNWKRPEQEVSVENVDQAAA